MTDGKILDERILKATWTITNDCYDRACLLMKYSMQDIMKNYLEDRINEDRYHEMREALDEKYRYLLCQLPSGVLQNMITAWETGQQKRAQKTIDTVTSELFERELVNELKEDEKGRYT